MTITERYQAQRRQKMPSRAKIDGLLDAFIAASLENKSKLFSSQSAADFSEALNTAIETSLQNIFQQDKQILTIRL